MVDLDGWSPAFLQWVHLHPDADHTDVAAWHAWLEPRRKALSSLTEWQTHYLGALTDDEIRAAMQLAERTLR